MALSNRQVGESGGCFWGSGLLVYKLYSVFRPKSWEDRVRGSMGFILLLLFLLQLAYCCKKENRVLRVVPDSVAKHDQCSLYTMSIGVVVLLQQHAA